MDIKIEHNNKVGKSSLLLFSLLLVLVIPLTSPLLNTSLELENTNDIQLYISSNSNLLVDKVYSFTMSNPILTFDSNIYLEKGYYYYITVKVVTPHECDMKISILDPEGDRYDITHELNMDQDDYREIPFGAALSGNHSFVFEVVLLKNLNVHIKIEKGDKVLEDKIHPDDPVIYNNITKFKTGNVFEFKILLKSDWYYKILIKRVSTISRSLNNSRISMIYLLWDPLQVEFKIFENKTVSYAEFYFGTAVEGIYTISIIIYIEADVECTNIVFAVVEKGKIATIIDPKNPIPDPPEEDPVIEDPTISNITESRVEYYIPQEFTSGLLIVIGIAVIIPTGLVIYRRRKNMGGL